MIRRSHHEDQDSHHARMAPIAAFAICLVCCISLAICFGSIVLCHQRATDALPSPEGTFQKSEDNSFSQVDWNYWQQVNPRIIGWIEIPGTPMSYPIVQAPANNPGHYLNHDVYDRWNYMGCPYLDVECADDGLMNCRNTILLGHNLGFGDMSMFASIASYVDDDFAAKHPIVLLQSPERKQAYRIAGAACIDGSRREKRTNFACDEEFQSWFEKALDNCSYRSGILADGDFTKIESVLTLCTCSYHFSDDERTLVYAIPTDDLPS